MIYINKYFFACLTMLLLPFSGKTAEGSILLNGKTDLTRKHKLHHEVDQKAHRIKKPNVVNGSRFRNNELDDIGTLESLSTSHSLHQERSILYLKGLIDAHALEKLKSRRYKSICLEAAYGNKDSSSEFQDYHLKISPSVINPDVEILRLHGCGLSSTHIEDVDLFKRLRKLYLSSNPIDDIGILKITKLGTLEYLDVSLTNITNKALEALSRMRSLSELNLSSNTQLTDEGIQHFYDHPRIKVLTIKGNKISTAAYQNLKKTIIKVDYFPG